MGLLGGMGVQERLEIPEMLGMPRTLEVPGTTEIRQVLEMRGKPGRFRVNRVQKRGRAVRGNRLAARRQIVPEMVFAVQRAIPAYFTEGTARGRLFRSRRSRGILARSLSMDRSAVWRAVRSRGRSRSSVLPLPIIRIRSSVSYLLKMSRSRIPIFSNLLKKEILCVSKGRLSMIVMTKISVSAALQG